MVAAPGDSSTKATPTSVPGQSVITRSHQLIASFLEAEGYTDTLAAFRREASAAFEGVDLLTPAEASTDLREVVEDYLTSRMHALAIPPAPLEDELLRLKLEAPLPTKVIKTIRDGTNVLTCRRGVLPKREWNGASGRFKSEFLPAIFTTAVDRTLKVYSSESYELLHSQQFPSPVLSIAVHPRHLRFVVAGMMEGSLHLLDLVTLDVVQKEKDHNKFIVRTAWSDDGHWIASIGYDRTVNIYQVLETRPTGDGANALLDGEEPDELASTPKLSIVLRHTHECKSNPEAVIFLPSSSHLVFACRDDHILHYLSLPSPTGPSSPTDYTLTGYNLNENGDAWVSFSVLYITLHPKLPLLSLQTSTENSRILLYPFHSSQRLLTLFTTAEQGEYSTPRHAWLPDGSAALVNSEDGILRVVDLQGKVRQRIPAHGVAGPVEEGEDDAAEGRLERARLRREADRGSSVVKDVAVIERDGHLVFVSCGFDKTLRWAA
ncbi:hypothetical protein RQP46_006820 [Phenoliferia psychrophenolica]